MRLPRGSCRGACRTRVLARSCGRSGGDVESAAACLSNLNIMGMDSHVSQIKTSFLQYIVYLKSTKMKHMGYAKDRFASLHGEMFDCFLCKQVTIEPKQCHDCGNMFCAKCIDFYVKQNGVCPNRCGTKITPLTAKVLINLYKQLEIRCLKCNKHVKIEILTKHEETCGKKSCPFSKKCNGFEDQTKKFGKYCSQRCKIVGEIVDSNGDPKIIYSILSQLPYQKIAKLSSSSSSVGMSSNSNVGVTNLKWNPEKCGTNIVISPDRVSVFLKQQAYVFRTVVVSQPFFSGRHYWEINADGRTQNELKIGVVNTLAFDCNTAFCDHKSGYAYYGLGQLRQGSNSTGAAYGQRFKKVGVLGVYLNMDKGTLSFCLNGQDFGIAYESCQLKKGPLYACVALLHCSGCIIKGQLPIPEIYKKK